MIVGLGNPGREYETSKHNTGFRVVDELAKRWNVTLWQNRMDAQVAQADVDGEKVILVKPQTYMNNSGQAVGPLMRWYKLEQVDVYVVYDDMDLPVAVSASARTAATAAITASRASLPTAAAISSAFASASAGLCRTAMSSTTC